MRALLSAENAEQLADLIVRQGLSVRDAEALGKDAKSAEKRPGRKSSQGRRHRRHEVDLEEARA